MERVCIHCKINAPMDQWGSVCEQCWHTAPNWSNSEAHENNPTCPCWLNTSIRTEVDRNVPTG